MMELKQDIKSSLQTVVAIFMWPMAILCIFNLIAVFNLYMINA